MDAAIRIAVVTLMHAFQLQKDSSVMIMECAAICILLASNEILSDPLGLSPLPRRSPSIYSKARSRIWFEEIVMNKNKFDDARYKFCFRMSRETVAYIVQTLYHDLQRTDTNFKQALSAEKNCKVKTCKSFLRLCCLRPCLRCSRSLPVYSLKTPGISRTKGYTNKNISGTPFCMYSGIFVGLRVRCCTLGCSFQILHRFELRNSLVR